MNRITACIITLNEDQNLPRALSSLIRRAPTKSSSSTPGAPTAPKPSRREHGAAFFSPLVDKLRRSRRISPPTAHPMIGYLDGCGRRNQAACSTPPCCDWKMRKPERCRLRGLAQDLVSRRLDQAFRLVSRLPAPALSPRLRAIFRHHPRIRCDSRAQRRRLTGDLLHYTVRSFDEHEANVERYYHPGGPADVRPGQAQLAQRGLVRYALELVPKFRTARRFPGRLPWRPDLLRWPRARCA